MTDHRISITLDVQTNQSFCSRDCEGLIALHHTYDDGSGFTDMYSSYRCIAYDRHEDLSVTEAGILRCEACKMELPL